MLSRIDVYDATPYVVRRYVLGQRDRILAVLRHDRLVDLFTGLRCYSLQSHLRASMVALGEVEIDEVYVGIGQTGRQYMLPIHAGDAKHSIGAISIERCLALCESKFPTLRCRPIAAQFIADDLVALFEFEVSKGEVCTKEERHYRLVPNDDLSDDELRTYRS
ncbi:MAG TPA: hypothetical protein PK019_18470 [Sedimentisphaerales bacterium]|nr:hypothetical protein [Sedimentisphaerales bacterium]